MDVEGAADLVLLSVATGDINHLPPPDTSWPAIPGGDLVATFGIRRTAWLRARPPEGYSAGDLEQITVVATLHLDGEAQS